MGFGNLVHLNISVILVMAFNLNAVVDVLKLWHGDALLRSTNKQTKPDQLL